MNRCSRPCTILCLILAATVLPAQDEGLQEQSATAMHMHEHLLRITAIKSEILTGDLAGIREPAIWLAGHEPMPDLPLVFEPFVLSMRGHASEIIDAEDIASAAVGVSAIARDCASCHVASEVDLEFGYDEEPPAWSDMQSHMQRHQWAVDRLWEGLIGPSDRSWSRGIRMLAEAPLHGTEATWDEDASDGDELARRVHTLGRQAASALTPEARGAVYGQILGVCAECHARTGGGPGS